MRGRGAEGDDFEKTRASPDGKERALRGVAVGEEAAKVRDGAAADLDSCAAGDHAVGQQVARYVGDAVSESIDGNDARFGLFSAQRSGSQWRRNDQTAD